MTEQEVKYYETRVAQFASYLPNLLYPEHVPLSMEVTTDRDPIAFEALADCEFRGIAEGDVWGANWSSAWFRLHGTVPDAWQGRAVVARLQFGGEACVFSTDGEPLQGLTGGSVYHAATFRERYPLFDPCEGGERVDLLVEAAANFLFGIYRSGHPVPGQPYEEHFSAKVEHARLCVFDRDMFHCWVDVSFLDKLMRSLPARSAHRAQILHGLSRAVSSFTYDKPNPGEIREILAPYFARNADAAQLVTTAVGHAHIDVAWLWPMRETIRKCARTFSTQLRLTESYPGYVFGASQAQLYQFVKDRYPALFRGIREAVRDGRWEVQGAMWVEADMNVPSGESLVRQLLYGKRFFQEEFGVDVKHLWLPDVFGYSAALPQLLKLAGVDTFLTQKISWNQFNRFPHHTFVWRGIDGTDILTHFPPEDTYNSELAPDRMRYAMQNFEERGFLPEFLTLFGVGDGGGGPLEENIENGLRMRDMPDCPRVEFGHAQPMFDRLKAHTAELAVWSDELYLEYHRGTLTTQARNKKMNRACELALRRTEILYSSLPPEQYPGAAFERLWKTVLKNQFHDIIPGSSIREVYEDSLRDYDEVMAELAALMQEAVCCATREGADQDDSVSLINTLNSAFQGAAHLPDIDAGAVETDAGVVAVQPAADGGGWVAAEVPALGATILRLVPAPEAPDTQSGATASETWLENRSVRYEFDESGFLARMFDKEAGRDMMRPGDRGNVLTLHEDWPHDCDAWEVEITYPRELRETAELVSRQVLEYGPHVAAIRIEWRVGGSTVRQDVRLSACSKRLDFSTYVDWRECRKMLRTAFSVDVTAARASYEIQFGLVRRPTHSNTSWDMARFEVCGHRFADLSDKDCGVALLNDCKYGYAVRERTLELNLLRSPYSPDHTADRGEQRFTYSILPHSGILEDSNVLAEAHLLNQPPLVLRGRHDLDLPCRVIGDGVVLETLKKAENEDAWVVRLYEPVGRRSACEVRTRLESDEVLETDIMEKPGRLLEAQSGSVKLCFRPFETKCLLIRPG